MEPRRYRIEFAPAAARAFRALPVAVQRRLSPKIDALATTPRPPGVVNIRGEQNLLRLRAGDYRIVYQVQDDALLVLVVRIGHRRDVYR